MLSKVRCHGTAIWVDRQTYERNLGQQLFHSVWVRVLYLSKSRADPLVHPLFLKGNALLLKVSLGVIPMKTFSGLGSFAVLF